MGSMITLAVGRLEIDWGKNRGFNDHSPLFQPSDETQVPYYYAEDLPEADGDGPDYRIVTEYRNGLSKPLIEVLDRVNLLGHSLEVCRLEFEYLSVVNGFDLNAFSFHDFQTALGTVDVQALSTDYGQGGEDFGKYARREILPRLGLSALERSLGSGLAEAFENVNAYMVIQMLAANPNARALPVYWAYDDIIEGGWSNKFDFVHPLERENKFLIVTEGSSDAAIIRQAFRLLRPHVADFFDYVDMEEGYPFSGAGNLFRFVQGLVSISVQNNILIVFDNDAEGVATFDRIVANGVPKNMRIIRLPNIQQFEDFDTVGPNGLHKADINGKAAAIECYLHLPESALIRWSSFNQKANTYQGELLGKTDYMRTFLDQRNLTEGYDYSKIERVLDAIIAQCASIREGELIDRTERWVRGGYTPF